MVLEKTLESPLDCKEIQPVHPKGNYSWIFIGRTDAEAETPILWPLDAKNWPIGKDPEAGKDWGQEEKGTTENEMVGWHHLLDGHEFKQTLGFGDGQGSLVCCSRLSCKESDMTERLNCLNCSWKTSFYLSQFPPEDVISIIQITQVHCHARFDGCFLFLFLFPPSMSKYLTDYIMLYLIFIFWGGW